jgi:hypothetical protein
MLFSIVVVTILMGPGDQTRKPVRGGFYEKWNCHVFDGWKTLPPFERFLDQEFGTKEFSCAVALYLDSPDVTPELKFEHLAFYANKSEKWGVALASDMAELDWAKYIERTYKRAQSLSQSEWLELCRLAEERERLAELLAPGHQKEGRPAERQEVDGEPSPRMLRLYYEVAKRSNYAIMPDCMFDNPYTTLDQALILARRFAAEEDGPYYTLRKGAILRTLTRFDAARTNKVIRDFLRGPLEHGLLERLCDGIPIDRAALVVRARYDFLPDLQALRTRLSAQKEIHKKNKERDAAGHLEEGIDLLDQVIPALEKKKQQAKEEAMKHQVNPPLVLQKRDGGRAE